MIENSWTPISDQICFSVPGFGLQTDYHKSSDEVKMIDFSHLMRSINSTVKPVEWLITSNFKPTRNEGKKPKESLPAKHAKVTKRRSSYF